MEASGDSRAVVDSKGSQTPNRCWLPLVATVVNIYKIWVLRQKFCGWSPMKFEYWNFLMMGQAPSWLFLLPSLCLHILYQGLGGWYGLLNSAKTWKTTRMNISIPILACLKEKCFLPDFSRTCTAKANSVMVKKPFRLLHYSWILNQVGTGGRKYCKKAAPTAKSVKNLHARLARIPQAIDNNIILPLL